MHASTRNAHYCYVTITSATATAVEADIEVLDEHGAVLLTVGGLRLGTGASATGRAHRVLNERLLTIDWRRQELPDAEGAEAGRWLVIGLTADAEATTAALAGELTGNGATVTSFTWAEEAAATLRDTLSAEHHAGVVLVAGSAGSPLRRPPKVRTTCAPWCASLVSCPRSRASRRGCSSSPAMRRWSVPRTSPIWTRRACAV